MPMRNSVISSANAPALSAVVAASANARVFFIVVSLGFDEDGPRDARVDTGSDVGFRFADLGPVQCFDFG